MLSWYPQIAKDLSIFKTGDPEKLENYRPISILPAFSKLYEKVVYNRIYKYWTNHNLLYNNQFGFRRNQITYMALIQLVNNIASAMDSRESTAGVFLDLSKAFDTILIITFCSISSITTVLEGILLIGSLAIWQTGSSLFSLL